MRTSTVCWTSLGVAGLANYALHILAKENTSAESYTHDNATGLSTTIDYNTTYIDTDNSTGNYTYNFDFGDGGSWFSFSNAGFRATVQGVCAIAVGCTVWACRMYFVQRRRAEAAAAGIPVTQPGEGAVVNGRYIPPSAQGVPGAGLSQPFTCAAPQVANAQQPTLTVSFDNPAFSNNNFLSNYSTAATYSSVGKL